MHGKGMKGTVMANDKEYTFKSVTQVGPDMGIITLDKPMEIDNVWLGSVAVAPKEGMASIFAIENGDLVLTFGDYKTPSHWVTTKPGVSGSPVFNSEGQIIGVHVVGATTANYMTPMTQRVVQAIRDECVYTHF